MLTLRTMAYMLPILAMGLVPGNRLTAQSAAKFGIEVESGLFWQSRNDVQIPNDATGTRFSLKDLAGGGPWPSVRFHLSWNLNDRHALRAVLAPLSVTETGSLIWLRIGNSHPEPALRSTSTGWQEDPVEPSIQL